MRLRIFLVLCSAGRICTDEITFTVTPNKDYFGRAVIVKAEPPKNYTALLYGPYSTNEFKFSEVFFNETGYWDNPGYRGSMQPYTEYTLTINISDTENVTTKFMTDVGVPLGGVDLVFTKNESTFLEVSLAPQFPRIVYGPPSGYHVEVCTEGGNPCVKYTCLKSICKLDNLQPATNYSVRPFVFNVDTFNRTLETRNWIKLYNVTTKAELEPKSEPSSPWTIAGGSIAALCGFGGVSFAAVIFSRNLAKKRLGASRTSTMEVAEL